MSCRVLADLYCGDALQVLRTLPPQSVNLCITSPPYGEIIDYANRRRGDRARRPFGTVDPNRYADWFLPIVQEISRVVVEGGVLAVNLGGQGSYTSRRSCGADLS